MAAATCPDCGTVLPTHTDWVTWCSACNWNVNTVREERSRTRLERLDDHIAARLGDRLAARVKATDDLRPRLTASTAAAYAIAACVQIAAVAVVLVAVGIAVRTFPNVFALVVAAAMVGFAWLIRPRYGKQPTKCRLERTDAPGLYGLAERVAAALETEPPDIVVLDDTVNAYWSVVTLRRRRVLAIGLPLLAVLDPSERVALIAHEVAHGRNGDVRRGLFVSSALNTLAEVYRLLVPGESALTYTDLGIVDQVTRAVTWILARPVGWLYTLEIRLLLYDMQRAEYLADSLAAKVAGRDAVVALHEKLLLEPVIRHAVQRATHDRTDPGSVCDVVAASVRGVPELERERRRRVAALERTRREATHPPTAMRIDVLESRAPTSPLVVLGDDESRAIDAELAPQRSRLGQALVDRYRESLYR